MWAQHGFTNVQNPRALIERKSEYKDTFVKKGQPWAPIVRFYAATIGEFAFIGAGALVNRDVPAYALMVGLPAKQIGWMSEFGEQLDLPLTGSATTKCKNTGDVYCLKVNSVTKMNIPSEPISKT